MAYFQSPQRRTLHITYGLIDAQLDFWRGAHQVWRRLLHRPVRLCVGYGVGSMQKYNLGFRVCLKSKSVFRKARKIKRSMEPLKDMVT